VLGKFQKMSAGRFPPIRSSSAPSNEPPSSSTLSPLSRPTQSEFHLIPDTVSDLFYDGTTDILMEIQKLQTVLNLSSSKVPLKKLYKTYKPMNRSQFSRFVVSYCEGIDENVANEIFSCSVNQFANEINEYGEENEEEERDELPDQDMSKEQFTTAIVRLANLWSLMSQGMAESSQLTKQTTQFLKHVS
jgi:hypothetical protein